MANMVPVDTAFNNNNNGDDNNNDDNSNSFNVGIYFGDDDFDSAYTSENDDQNSRPNKKKRYHRHSHHQIQEMEAFFRECPHPDDKQRKELSRLIGLDHLQIKFWFQNKRTQNKNQQERQENTQLRSENERLKAEHRLYTEAIIRATCSECGGRTAIAEMSFEELQLRIENARLTQEIAKLNSIAGRMANPVMVYPLTSPPLPPAQPLDQFPMGNMNGNGGIANGLMDAVKPKIMEFAVRAMDELMMMAQIGDPLWMLGVNGTSLVLNFDEYNMMFHRGIGRHTPFGFRVEASKATAIVPMGPTDVVNMLMDQYQWPTMFAGMVSRAMTLEVLSTRVSESYNGAFHLITAEFQVLSPGVSTRESYFVRYCQQQGEGLWAVVDVSIDHFVPHLESKCRRRPSGCLIQEIPNGFSKVIWVEHVEVDDRAEVHNMYHQLISSGQAFSADRWITTFDRQCERLASIMALNLVSIESDDQIRMSNHGKKSILKLAEKMARNFFAGVTSSNEHMWNVLTGGGGDGVRVMAGKTVVAPGNSTGVVLCATTSFWIPVTPKTIFEFLSDENNRSKWDVLSARAIVQKMAHIENGRDSRNCVSLLRSESINSENIVMMIQESSTDPTASFVMYAPVDIDSMEAVLNGGEPDYVTILPSGFVILPDGNVHPGIEGGGSLLTVAFQILVDATPKGKLTISSVATIESMIRATVDRIKALSQPPYYMA